MPQYVVLNILCKLINENDLKVQIGALLETSDWLIIWTCDWLS